MKKLLSTLVMSMFCMITLSSCWLLYSGEESLTHEEKLAKLEEISVEYIRNKYGISATMLGFYDDRMDYGKPRKEQMYYVVPMQITDKSFDPNARGRYAIKRTRRFEFMEDVYEALDFYVYIQANNYEVISDSYMWYKFYPWLDKIIDDNIEQYAQGEMIASYFKFTIGHNTNFFMFPSDYPIPETEEQYEKVLSDSYAVIYFYVPSTTTVTKKQEERFNETVNGLNECGMSHYNMNLNSISYEDYQEMLEEFKLKDVKSTEFADIKEK